jgi:hypothetical protein
MFVTVCHHVSARNDESHECHEIVFDRVRAEIRFEVEQEGRDVAAKLDGIAGSMLVELIEIHRL